MIRFLTIALLLLLSCAPVRAVSSAETRAFKAATDMFRDQLYSTAESNFAAFVGKFPNSELRAEAVLFQARARLHQTNYTGAVQLLEEQLPNAGNLADHYHFWIGETFFQQGEFEKAAAKFEQVISSFPNSPLLLEACYNQALSLSRLSKWDRVVEFLGKTGGAFQKTVLNRPLDRFAAQGLLLLGEAHFNQKKFAEAEKILTAIQPERLSPESRWKQQYLMVRCQLATGRTEVALNSSSNLVQTATLTRPALLAESFDLQAGILEKLKRLADAVEVHDRNLVDNAPDNIRRHALLKIIELTLAQNKTADAITRLERVVEQSTNAVALDFALFTLGELRMKQFFSSEPGTDDDAARLTNSPIALKTGAPLLQSALTNFDQLITNFPQSEFAGKAFLNRGWCFWTAGRFDYAKTNFSEALQRLPALSEEQAVARCKLADSQFALQEFRAAVSNYNAVITNFTEVPAVRAALFDRALYQVVRAGIAAGDHEIALDAMAKILKWYPNTGYGERVRLLVGQYLTRQGNPQEARALYSEFVERFPDSPLLPQVRLALAQSYMRDAQWDLAIGTFKQWIASFPNHALVPHAEFSLGLATYRSGQETNALEMFVDFVSKYPSNSLAPLAQVWIGDYYFNREEFALAEENYQLVSKLNPPLEVACQARISGGRAAFERQGFREARENYFVPLINDTNTPAQFLAEAYFALGDTIYTQFLADTNRSVDDFREAINAYSHVTKDFATNALAPLAWGKLGECHYQWAVLLKDWKSYEDATNAFYKVIESNLAPAAAKQQANIRIGNILEAKGDMDGALAQYAKVLYAQQETEFDPRCVKEAGLAAARLCESRQQWEQAINIYRRILSVLPSLKGSLEKKISVAQVNLVNVAVPKN